MPDLDYVKVIGRLGIVVRDSEADVNAEPDTVWCDEGEVHFTPLVAAVKVAEADPVPITLGRSTIIGTIDAEGYLSLRGIRSVMLEDLTSDKVNPKIEAGKATHKVEFIGLMADGEPVTLPSPVNVRFAADTADEFGNCDLTLLMPVPVSGGTAQIVGPRGPSAYQVWIAAGNTGTFADFMAEYVEVEIPSRLGSETTFIATNNWDDAIQNGWYRDYANATNAPGTSVYAGMVINVDDAGFCIQTVWDAFVENPADNKAYRRYKVNNTWSAWSRIRETQAELDARYFNHTDVVADSNLPGRLRGLGIQTGDWNTVRESGWYWSGIDSGAAANAPYVSHWAGQVDSAWGDGNWPVQRLWDIIGNPGSNNPIVQYERRMYNGVWGSWKRLRTTEEELDARYLNSDEVVADSNLPVRLKGNSVDGAIVTSAPGAVDAATKSGFYAWQTDPSGGTGSSLLVNAYNDNTYVTQIAIKWSGQMWFRAKEGAWSAWKEIYAGADADARYLNVDEVVGNGNLPARIGSQQGGGFGATVTNPNDAIALGTGWCYWSGASAVAMADAMLETIVYGNTGSYASQIAYSLNANDGNETWRRTLSNGTWTAWSRVLDSATDARIGTKGAQVTDLNAATDNGIYYANNLASNLPVGWWGILTVKGFSNGEIHQTYETMGTYDDVNDGASGRVYRRWGNGNGSNWFPWIRVRSEDMDVDRRYLKINGRAGGVSLVQSNTHLMKDENVFLSLPVGWKDESVAPGSAYGEPIGVPGSDGRLLVVTNGAGAAGTGVVSSDFFPVAAGQQFRFSADLWYTGAYPANWQMRFVWTDANKNVFSVIPAISSRSDLPNLDGFGPGLHCMSETHKAPAGAFYGYVQIVVFNVGSAQGYIASANPRVDRVTGAEVPTRLTGSDSGYAEHLSHKLSNDWNNAVQTGWYMSDNGANAPQAGVWYIGEVVVHNTSWVTQEVWNFTHANPSDARWRRHCNNGVWGAWQKVMDTRPVLEAAIPEQIGSSVPSAPNQDANQATNTGRYALSGPITGGSVNGPTALGDAWGHLSVTNFGGQYIHQEWWPWENNHEGARFERRYLHHSGWTPWVRVRVRESDQLAIYGRFGYTNTNSIANANDATAPGAYNWSGGTATSPNKIFALAGDYGAELFVTTYDSQWIKQEARIYDTDQRWVRFRNGAVGLWGDWVLVVNKALDRTRQNMAAKSGSGRNLVFNGRFDFVSDPTQQVLRTTDRLHVNVPGWRCPAWGGSVSGARWTLGGISADGGLSLGLRAANNTEGFWVETDPFPVTPGKTYRWKFKVWSDNPIPQGIFMGLALRKRAKEYTDFNDQLVTDYQLVANDAHVGSTFVPYEGYTTIPAGDAHVAQLRPHAWIGSNPNGINNIYYTDIEFEEVIPTAALGDTGWRRILSAGGISDMPNLAAAVRRVGNQVTVVTSEPTAGGTRSGFAVLGYLPSGFRYLGAVSGLGEAFHFGGIVCEAGGRPIPNSSIYVDAGSGGQVVLMPVSGQRHYAHLTFTTADPFPAPANWPGVSA